MIIHVFFSFDEAQTCEHLGRLGHAANVVPPLIPLSQPAPSTSQSEGTSRETLETANSSLVLLDAEVEHLRESVNKFKANIAQARQSNSHPSVIPYYSEEVGCFMHAYTHIRNCFQYVTESPLARFACPLLIT